MKLITAIIRPDRLDPVRHALAAFHAPGLTVTALMSDSRWNRHLEVYRATVLVADLVPRLRVDLLAPDDEADELAGLLARVANAVGRSAGRQGGDDTVQVWISHVEQAVRIRTGERGEGVA